MLVFKMPTVSYTKFETIRYKTVEMAMLNIQNYQYCYELLSRVPAFARMSNRLPSPQPRKATSYL